MRNKAMKKRDATENIDLFCFGEFVLDSAQRELRKQGTPVEIEPRAFDVLLYLARNRDRAVDKDELQDAAWPGMIVTETALTRAVMKARKAVDDDASSQAVIKTLHGHGYRFVARVETNLNPPEVEPGLGTDPSEEGAPGDADAPAQGDGRGGARNRPRIMIAAMFVLAFVIVLAWLGVRTPAGTNGESQIAVMPVSDSTGNPELAWSRLGLMSFVSQLLGANGELSVVPEAHVVSLADHFQWEGDAADPVSRDLFETFRTNFGVSHILVMELKSEGRMLRMNYHLLGSNQRSQSGTIVGDQPTELAQGVVQSVYGMLLRKSRPGDEFALVSEDPFNNEAFARGMSLSLAGRCAEARQFFKVIIEQEPGLVAPRFEYASCLRILGEPVEAEAILNQLLNEQLPDGPQRSLAQTLMTLGILYHRTGRPDQAIATYTEALEVSEQMGDHELMARVLQNLSITRKSFGELDEAERLLDLAVLEYQDAGRQNLPGQLYSGKANIEMARGDFTQAEVYLQQALKAFRNIGDRRSEAMMLNNMGYLKWQQGSVEDAGDLILQSLAIRQAIGDRVGVGRNYTMLAGIYSATGDHERAVEAANSALEIARESNDRLYVATSLAQLAEAETARGDLGAARQHYLEGRGIFEDINDQLRILQSDVKIARVDLFSNRIDEAQSLVTQVLDAARQQELLEPEVEAMELLGDIELIRGDSRAAALEFAAALERVHETSWTGMETTLQSKLANAYMDQNDLEAAAPLAGALAAKVQDVQVLLTRARFDYLRANPVSAVALMTEAKNLAKEKWSQHQESLLQQYAAETVP